MNAKSKSALFSVVAALALVGLKLGAGLASGSLGLISESVHSGADFVAALLTLFAIRVALRPPDESHSYGHGKAEHLAALGEGVFLVLASCFVAVEAVMRLTDGGGTQVNAAWYTFAVIGLVLVIDLSRAVASRRAARRYRSAALASNSVHFAGDLMGTFAVLIGLLLTRAGYPAADSIAALLVAALVLVLATRLMRGNIDTLMDRVPVESELAARQAIEQLAPGIELLGLRVRRAADCDFVEATVAVPPSTVVGQAHAAADRVEAAVSNRLPHSDVFVHVEPASAGTELREKVLAAALTVPSVREIHNVELIHTEGGTEISLHVKLPGDLPISEAHDVATDVERAVREGIRLPCTVHTHIEPLAEPETGDRPAALDDSSERDAITAIVIEIVGTPPQRLRLLATDGGIVAFVTVAVGAQTRLDDAHTLAASVRRAVRDRRPAVTDVFVHTEP